MSSAISSVGGYSAAMMQGMGGGPRAMKRPNADQMAEQIFSKLDTDNQGYLEVSDFSAALGDSSSSSDSLSADELFSSLDSDSDGKVTKDELSSRLKALSDELDSQFNAMRTQDMSGMQGMGGMPPPPPPPNDEDEGLSQDQISQMASEAGDTEAATRFAELAASFDEADTDGNGKVSFAESIAFEKSAQSSSDSSTASSNASDSDRSSTVASNSDARVMMQLMQLMRSYGLGDGEENQQQSSLLDLMA